MRTVAAAQVHLMPEVSPNISCRFHPTPGLKQLQLQLIRLMSADQKPRNLATSLNAFTFNFFPGCCPQAETSGEDSDTSGTNTHENMTKDGVYNGGPRSGAVASALARAACAPTSRDIAASIDRRMRFNLPE